MANNFIQGIKGLLRDSNIEIWGMGVLGLMAGTTYGYSKQISNASNIPLAFSEIHQIIVDHGDNKLNVDPNTYHYALTNDMVMKIFECHNLSYEKPFSSNPFVKNTKKWRKGFATELEYKIDLSHHYFSLKSLLETLPEYTRSALDKLEEGNFIELNKQIVPVNNHLDQAWWEDHYHHEHEECGPPDEDGDRSCWTVYDGTTHTFKYDGAAGNEAAAGLIKVVREVPELIIPVKMKIATQTNAENEYAIEKTQAGGKRLTTQELRQSANRWMFGSTYKMNIGSITSTFNKLPEYSERWNNERYSAETLVERDMSRSHPGPKEFQVGEAALANGQRLQLTLSQVINGMRYTERQTPVLQSKIKRFIDLELNHEKPKFRTESKKVASEILDISRKMYQMNIKGGFDVSGFNGWMILLFAGLGAVAGAAVGFGLDVAGDHFKWYGSRNNRGFRVY
ncbi:hypothetical protein ACFL1H_05540 [Nanoarchaeota archaeon]